MADNLEKLTCPACGEEMKKIYLSEAGINIDLCLNSCGGILFDNREFEKVDELDEKIDTLLDAIKGKTFKKVDTSETRVCPICGTPMVKIGTEISGVEIDYCNSCAVKFLDNGELIKIRENPVGELSEEIKGLIERVYCDDFDNVTFGLAPKKSSPRRQLVEDIIREILYRI